MPYHKYKRIEFAKNEVCTSLHIVARAVIGLRQLGFVHIPASGGQCCSFVPVKFQSGLYVGM